MSWCDCDTAGIATGNPQPVALVTDHDWFASVDCDRGEELVRSDGALSLDAMAG